MITNGITKESSYHRTAPGGSLQRDESSNPRLKLRTKCKIYFKKKRMVGALPTRNAPDRKRCGTLQIADAQCVVLTIYYGPSQAAVKTSRSAREAPLEFHTMLFTRVLYTVVRNQPFEYCGPLQAATRFGERNCTTREAPLEIDTYTFLEVARAWWMTQDAAARHPLHLPGHTAALRLARKSRH